MKVCQQIPRRHRIWIRTKSGYLPAAGQHDGHSPPTPFSRPFLESACDLVTAKRATVNVEVPFAKHIPVALAESLAAPGAARAAAISVVNVAGIDVVQALRERDLASVG